MARRNQFTVDAESVQGNEGAEVTFRPVKVREMREYRTTDQTDDDMLKSHVVKWSGIQGDDGQDLPTPQDEPEAVGELYLHEQRELIKLLFQGPDGEKAKN